MSTRPSETHTLLDLVRPSFEQYRQTPAVMYDDEQTVVISTYSHLHKSAKQVAGVLKRTHVTDEVIGLCVPPSQHLPAILLGVMDAGAAFYSFEPTSVNFVRQVVKEIGIRFLLLSLECLQTMDGLVCGFDAAVVCDTGLESMGVALVHLQSQKRQTFKEDLAYCITTSGTTGTPKIVRVPHRCIAPNISHLSKIFGIHNSDLVFLSSPLTFDPSIVDIFMALACGACLLVVPHVVKMMPKSLLTMLYYRHKVTYLQATPTLISRIGTKALRNTLLGNSSQLRILAFGGEKFPSLASLQKWRAPDNQTKFYNLYGTTEVSCWSTCYEVTEQDFRTLLDSVPLGLPLKDTMVIVRDDGGDEVHDGTGQIYLGGIKERRCYLDNEDPNTKLPCLRPTGDRAAVNRKGEITFLHRQDDQVKRNGRRINLCEIEKVVLTLEAVTSCTVLYEKNKLTVFVVPQGSEIMEPPHIQNWLQGRLPSQYWPDQVVMVTNFPVTRHGKLDKAALLLTREQTKVASESVLFESIPDLVASMWKEVLVSPDLEPSQNSTFLQCGGDSLLAVQFSDKVESALNIHMLRLLDVILHETFSDVLMYIETSICESRKLNAEMSDQRDLPLSQDSVDILKKNVLHNLSNMKQTETELEIPKFGTETSDFALSNSLKDAVNQMTEDGVSHKKLVNRKRKFNCNTDADFSMDICKEEDSQKLTVSCDLTDSDHWSVRGHRIGSVGKGNGGLLYEASTYPCPVRFSQNLDPVLQKDALTLTVCWKVDTGKCVDASPVIATERDRQHTVYIGSHSHKLYAVTMETGEVQWEITLGDRIESSACVSNCGQYTIVGCYDGAVYVVEQSTGEIWWMYQTGAEVKSSPVVDRHNSLVYVGSHDKYLYALDIAMRTCVYKTYLGGGSVFSSPSVRPSPHTVYVGTLAGCLVAVSPSTGSMRWTYDCGKPLFASPCWTPEGVCIGCVDGCIYHLNIDGKLIWTFQSEAPVFSSPILYPNVLNKDKSCTEHSTNPVLVFGSHDQCIYCVSLRGELLWKMKLDSPVYSTPFCVDLLIGRPCYNTCGDVHKGLDCVRLLDSQCVGLGNVIDKQGSITSPLSGEGKEDFERSQMSVTDTSDDDSKARTTTNINDKCLLKRNIGRSTKELGCSVMGASSQCTVCSSCGLTLHRHHHVRCSRGKSGHCHSDTAHCYGDITHHPGDTEHCHGDTAHGYGDITHRPGDTEHCYGDTAHCHSDITHRHGNTTHCHGNTTHCHGNTTHTHGNTTHTHGNTTHTHGNTIHTHGSTTHCHGNTTQTHGNTTHCHGNTTHCHGNTTHTHGSTTHCHGNTTHIHGNTTHCHGNTAHCSFDTTQAARDALPLCVVTTTRGTVYVIDRVRGRELGVATLPGEVFSSPVICGQYIVVGCRDDYVYGLKIT